LRSRAPRLAVVVLCSGWALSGASVQEAPAAAILDAAYVLKVAASVQVEKVTILSPNRAAFTEVGGRTSAIERTGRCAFELKAENASGLRIDFNRVSAPVQHACGRSSCTIRLSGAGGAVCVTSPPAEDQCRGFLSIGPLPVETAREALASIARLHAGTGCEPLRPGAPR
jgi:hypothetical protein